MTPEEHLQKKQALLRLLYEAQDLIKDVRSEDSENTDLMFDSLIDKSVEKLERDLTNEIGEMTL